jgi:hypothetical protein
MKTRKLFFILLVFAMPLNIYAQGAYRDPFESLLPKEEAKIAIGGEKAAKALPSLSVVVQGVLWGSDMPQAIIDGDVYRVGDKLKKIDAKVFRIMNNVVFIAYGDKIYKMMVEKQGERRIEEVGKKEAK